MNFYGDSFHVTQPGKPWSGHDYSWTYGTIDTTINLISKWLTQLRVKITKLRNTYTPWQVNLGAFTTPDRLSSAKFPRPQRPVRLLAVHLCGRHR